MEQVARLQHALTKTRGEAKNAQQQLELQREQHVTLERAAAKAQADATHARRMLQQHLQSEEERLRFQEHRFLVDELYQQQENLPEGGRGAKSTQKSLRNF